MPPLSATPIDGDMLEGFEGTLALSLDGGKTCDIV
jgi:hypothetical protein